MFGALLSVLKALCTSKKAVILAATAIAEAAALWTGSHDLGELVKTMRPVVLTYIGAQGLQDGLSRLRK